MLEKGDCPVSPPWTVAYTCKQRRRHVLGPTTISRTTRTRPTRLTTSCPVHHVHAAHDTRTTIAAGLARFETFKPHHTPLEVMSAVVSPNYRSPAIMPVESLCTYGIHQCDCVRNSVGGQGPLHGRLTPARFNGYKTSIDPVNVLRSKNESPKRYL